MHMKNRLLCAALASLVVALASCSPLGGTSSNEGSQASSNKVSFSKIADCVADVFNGRSIGIASRSRPSDRKAAPQDGSIVDTNEYDKNYIVVSNEEYAGGEAHFEDKELTKVTFTKIITTNVTTQMSGEKKIVAFDGSISFKCYDGFTYSLFDGETKVLDGFTDNNYPDSNPVLGIVTLNNLEADKEYTLKYSGIGEEEIITQEELDGEVDKLFVLNDFIFISFVPAGLSRRGTQTHEDDYDQIGYTTDNGRASFVINNKTGFVYDLKDFPVHKISRGVVLDENETAHDMSISENNELIFTKIVRNETLEILNVFKDRHGNIFVENDSLDAFDDRMNAVYYTKPIYFPTSSGDAIYFEHNEAFSWGDGVPSHVTSIKRVGPGFEKLAIAEDETYIIDFVPCVNNSVHSLSNVTVDRIEGGYLYMRGFQSYAFSYFYRYDVNNQDGEECLLTGNSYGECGDGAWILRSTLSCPINHHQVLLWTNMGEGNDLYYGEVFGDNVIRIGYTSSDISTFRIANANLLLEDCQYIDWSSDYSEISFKKVTIEETAYYIVVSDGNGEPRIVNSSTYVAPEVAPVVLQPINR